MASRRITFIFLFLVSVAAFPMCGTAQLATAQGSALQQESVIVERLKTSLADLLVHKDYDGIDRVANQIRSEKTRLIGGGWLLKQVYFGLEAAHGTTPEEHIEQLKAWVAARPQSITARVALAKAYTSYAWLARGGGYANSVTPDRQQRFTERIAEAQHVLDDSANLAPMCPEWFAEMQTVALAQSWDAARAANLFQSSIRFEPDYFYFYKYYANYLEPKWDGHEGEAAEFAKNSADAVGGQKGDFLYFHIAMVVLGARSGVQDARHMDWERLQRGYQAQQNMYGVVSFDINEFALMAWRFQDRAVAKSTFNQIGDKWSKEVWGSRSRFEKAREWADG